MAKNLVNVTFDDLKSGQKVVVSIAEDTKKNEAEINMKFDPQPTENTELGLLGVLLEQFVRLFGDEDFDKPVDNERTKIDYDPANTTEGDCG